MSWFGAAIVRRDEEGQKKYQIKNLIECAFIRRECKYQYAKMKA